MVDEDANFINQFASKWLERYNALICTGTSNSGNNRGAIITIWAWLSVLLSIANVRSATIEKKLIELVLTEE